MRAKKTFDAVIVRSERYIFLYELLHNTRKRRARAPWMDKVKAVFSWGKKDEVFLIENTQGKVFVRNSENLTEANFEHELVSELLRSAVVSAVAALDRYMHDVVLEKSLKILRRPEGRIPKEWDAVRIPAHQAIKAANRVKQNSAARPGNEIKFELQEVLYKKSFQGSRAVEDCAKLLGISDVWGQIANKWSDWSNGEVKKKIDEITRRRNQIVHEADLVRKTRGGKDTLQDIKKAKAEDYIAFIYDFADAFDELAEGV